MSMLPDLLACATCIVDENSTTAQATNQAILIMLGMLAIVFGSAAFFTIRRFARLARAAEATTAARVS